MKLFITINIICLIVLKAVSQTTSLQADSSVYLNQNKILFEKISFADSIILYDPGALGENTGDEPSQKYQNTQKALGKPDCVSDNDTGFVSLGNGGTLIIKFTDNILINGSGADLKIFEVSNDEDIKVWVSRDNKIYIPLKKTAHSNYEFDFGPQTENSYFYKFIKIRDIYNFDQSPAKTDQALGADIDAVSALNTAKRLLYKTDSLFKANSTDLSESGKNILSFLAAQIKNLPHPILSINSYSYQKANDQYLSLSTYIQADRIRQYLFNEKEITHAEYQISGKGYTKNIKHSIIEILIKSK